LLRCGRGYWDAARRVGRERPRARPHRNVVRKEPRLPVSELKNPPPLLPSPTCLLCGLRWDGGAIRSSSFSRRKRFFATGGDSSAGVLSSCDAIIGVPPPRVEIRDPAPVDLRELPTALAAGVARIVGPTGLRA